MRLVVLGSDIVIPALIEHEVLGEQIVPACGVLIAMHHREPLPVMFLDVDSIFRLVKYPDNKLYREYEYARAHQHYQHGQTFQKRAF